MIPPICSRTLNNMAKYHFTFPGTEKAFEISDYIFEKVIDTIDAEMGLRQQLKLILSELYMNAYLHGVNNDISKTIEVYIDIGEDEFTTIVKDEGKGLTENQYSELVNAEVDYESESGRGMKIVHRLSDKVELFWDEAGKFCMKCSKGLKNKPIIVDKNG